MTRATRIYLGLKFHSDGANRRRVHALVSAINNIGIQCECLVSEGPVETRVLDWERSLMLRAFKHIGASDIILIDSTEPSVGAGVEAGYAFARNIPIITIAQKQSNISDTLIGVSARTGYYSDIEELPCFLSNILRGFVR